MSCNENVKQNTKNLPNPLAQLRYDSIRTLDLDYLGRIDDITTVELRTLYRLWESSCTTRSDRHIAHPSITVMCLTPDESHLLHREEEPRDPTRRESDRIREIYPSQSSLRRHWQCMEYEKIRESESTQPSIELAGEYRLDAREWDKKWKSMGEWHKNKLKIYLTDQVYWKEMGSQNYTLSIIFISVILLIAKTLSSSLRWQYQNTHNEVPSILVQIGLIFLILASPSYFL